MSLEEEPDLINIGNKVDTGENFGIEIEEIDNNMFICGLPNMGQEDFLLNFLINYNEIYADPFLIIHFDEKLHELQNYSEKLLILKPGENFSLNIFDPMDIDPIIHAGKLLEWFKLILSFNDDAILEKIIFDTLVEVITFQNLQDWDSFLELIDQRLSKVGRSDESINIRNKTRKFSIGPFKKVFQKDSYFSSLDLFEQSVLLDLSSILRLNGKIDDLLLVSNIILKLLNEYIGFNAKHQDEEAIHITYFQYKEIFDRSELINNCIEELSLISEQSKEITIFDVPEVNDNTKKLLAHCSSILGFRMISQELLLKNLSFTFNYDIDFSNLILGRCVFKSNLMNLPVLIDVTEINIIRDYSEIDQYAKQISILIDKYFNL